MIDESMNSEPIGESLTQWSVPIELISWQVAGSRKSITLVWDIFASSIEIAAEKGHSIAGRLVGQQIVTGETFTNPKKTTNRFEVYKIRVKKEEITMIVKDLNHVSETPQGAEA